MVLLLRLDNFCCIIGMNCLLIRNIKSYSIAEENLHLLDIVEPVVPAGLMPILQTLLDTTMKHIKLNLSIDIIFYCIDFDYGALMSF